LKEQTLINNHYNSITSQLQKVMPFKL